MKNYQAHAIDYLLINLLCFIDDKKTPTAQRCKMADFRLVGVYVLSQLQWKHSDIQKLGFLKYETKDNQSFVSLFSLV